jgi:hypothetical protein
MIEFGVRSGRPSEIHERRAETLGTMARLSGYVVEIDALVDGGRPDVLLVRPGDRSIFVGDAKATEIPGNAETTRRLSRYARFLARYVRSGGSGVFALVVPVRNGYEWRRVLRDVCAPLANSRPVDGRVDLIDPASAVVWQWFDGADT